MNSELRTKNYIPVIGLEVHVELKTASKMFCSCSADYFGKEPNTHVCQVCLGLPGALPVPNKQAIEWCVMIGLALNCDIPNLSKFDRKNYFYPDLPKGYQISQYDQPFCVNGHIVIARSEATRQSQKDRHALDFARARDDKKTIGIRRVHMEEDTAKLVHEFGKGGYSLIDFNRSGVPLVEIVTEPDFSSASEVVEYLKKLQQTVRYLGVSNADMEKGDMRLEPNISLVSLRGAPSLSRNDAAISKRSPHFARDDNGGLPNYKVEVKNINSFRFVDRAIEYEITRQKQLLEKGETPKQETMGWNESRSVTLPQRSKEEAHDYRYFPEPDIPPMRWTLGDIGEIRERLPELPDAKFARFKKEYEIPDYDAEILTRDRSVADYFEEAVRAAKEVSSIKYQVSGKQIANWIINRKVDIEKTFPAQLVATIASSTQTAAIDESELESIIKQVIQENPKAVSDYQSGKESAIMFLLGQVVRKQSAKVDPRVIIEKIKTKLT